MNEISSLLTAADEHFEANRYSEARAAYQEYLRLGGEPQAALANLGLVERQERMAFLREVTSAHPYSIACQYALAQVMIESGYASHAYELCSSLLGRSLDDKDQFIVRRLRFKSALSSARLDSLANDLKWLWNPPTPVTGSVRFRPSLIRDIAEVSDVESIHCLESIARENWIDDDLREFLKAKVAELQALGPLLAIPRDSNQEGTSTM